MSSAIGKKEILPSRCAVQSVVLSHPDESLKIATKLLENKAVFNS